jgi:proteasome accessory factor BC
MSPPQEPEKRQPKDTDQNIRRLSLVTFLLSRPGRPVSAAEIRMCVEGYALMTDEAFKKRFQEDRAELGELGIAVDAEPGDDGDVYRLQRDAYYLTSVHLDLEEVTALAACLAVLDGAFAYSQPLRLALLSLAQDRPELLAEAELPPLAVARETSEPLGLLPKLQAAVDDRKSVRFTYYTIARDEEMERTVDPYGLQLVAGEWYLIGRCHLRDDVRTFRLSRIHSRVVHATKRLHDFVRPEDFDLEAYRDRPAWRLAAVRGTARVCVGPTMAWWVEAHWSHCGSVERRPDGGIVYTTDYADPRPLLSWVLNLADAAELLEPAELRARLREQLGALEAAFGAPAPDAGDTAAAPAEDEAPARRRRRHADEGHVEVDRFTRLSTLATYLLTSCGQNEADLDVSEIRAALGMTRDQLREDVRVLNDVGYVGGGTVLYAEFKGRGKLHVMCDLEGPTLSRPARLSPLQADAILLAIDLVGGQLPSTTGTALESARQKIRDARETPPTLSASDLLPGDADVLDSVNAAIAGKRLLRIEYWKEGTEGFSERVVEPYLVIHERGEWYYICWCRSAEGRRMFRVVTTRTAELLAETFAPRDDLELELYRREGVPTSKTYAPKTATVWYSPLVTRWVEERQPVRRLVNGSCLAEQPYIEEGWLTQHLLPFADQARLLAPPEAVEHLRGAVGRLIALYD